MFIMFHVLPFYLFWIWCFVFYHSGLSFRCSVSRICSVFRVVFRILPQLYERAKMVQNDKQLCLLCSISLEPYIVWLSFMVHKCYAMIISPGIFFSSFSKFWFSALLWGGGGGGGGGRGWKGEKLSKMTTNSVCDTPYHHMIVIYVRPV